MCRLPKINNDLLESLNDSISIFRRNMLSSESKRSKVITVDKRKKTTKKNGFNRSFSKFNLTVSNKSIQDFFGTAINTGSFISTRATLTIGLKEIYFSVSTSGNRIPITKYKVDIKSDGINVFVQSNDILEAILYKHNIPYEIGPCPTRSDMNHVEYVINKIAGVYIFNFDAPMSILTDNNKNMIVSHDKFTKILDDIRIFNNNYDIATTIGKYLRFVDGITNVSNGVYSINVMHHEFYKERPHIRGKVEYPIVNGFIDDSNDVPVLSTLIEYYRYYVDEDDFRHFMNVIEKGTMLEITHIAKAQMYDTYITSGMCITKDSTKQIPMATDVKDLVFENSDYGITIFTPENKNYFWNVNGIIHKIDTVYGENLAALIWYRDIEGSIQHIRINHSEFRQYNILTTSEIDSVIESSYMSVNLKKKSIDVKLKELDVKGDEITHQLIRMAHDEEMFKMKMVSEKEKNEFLIYSLELKLEELKTNHKINGMKQASAAIASITSLISTLKSLIL